MPGDRADNPSLGDAQCPPAGADTTLTEWHTPTASTARSAGCAPSCCTAPVPSSSGSRPRNNDKLLFDGIPWVGRAQDEHDAFAQALRDHDVEVLYLADLLVEALEVEQARDETIAGVLADPRLGDVLHGLRRGATCTTCTPPTWRRS